MTSAVEVLMGVSSFLGLGFMFITNNPDTPALQLLHNNSYTTLVDFDNKTLTPEPDHY